MAKKKNKRRNTAKKNDLFAKILSVVAAVILWFFVVDTQTKIEEKAIYSVPVVIENFKGEDNVSIVSGMDHTVDVVVKGEASDISDLNKDDIYASIDMTGINVSGEYQKDIVINTPSDIMVVSRTPKQGTVVLEKTISSEFPIAVNITNYSISDDYEMLEPTLEFNTVIVTGPERFLSSVAGAEVRLNLGELRGNKTVKGQILLVDADGKEINSPYLKLSKLSTEVRVRVKKTQAKLPESLTEDIKTIASPISTGGKSVL